MGITENGSATSRELGMSEPPHPEERACGGGAANPHARAPVSKDGAAIHPLMLRDAALRAAPQHEGTSELQFGMRSAVLVLRSARAVEAPQIGAGVRASRRMRTPLMPRARGPHASRRRLRRLLSMREESAENGATMAKRIHDRASGASCKARVVAFSCFRPVPACYRGPSRAAHATPPARISRLHPAA